MSSSNTLSVVIPHWPKSDEHEFRLERCLNSIIDQFDQVTVVVNEGIGYSRAVNVGARCSWGTHILFLNNDTFMEEGSHPLISLTAHEGCVTFPVVNGKEGQDFCGPALCFPKRLFFELGMFDEGYKVGFWEDVDMWMKIKTYLHYDIPTKEIKQVRFSHPEPGFTMKTIEGNHEQENRERFFSKWKVMPEKKWV